MKFIISDRTLNVLLFSVLSCTIFFRSNYYLIFFFVERPLAKIIKHYCHFKLMIHNFETITRESFHL